MATNDYAIVIGLNHYNNGIPPLKGAVADAQAFEDWLTNDTLGGNVPSDNIITIVSGGPVAPDFEHIRQNLQEIIDPYNSDQHALKRRRLYIYMAGHGVSLVLDTSSSSDSTALLSLEVSRTGRSDYYHHFAAGIVKKALELTCHYQDAILIMDCCRNPLPYSGINNFWTDRHNNNGMKAPTFYEMYAASYPEEAREIDDGNGHYRGAFTLSLINHLKGAVDDSNRITFGSVTNAIRNDPIVTEHQSPTFSSAAELVFNDNALPTGKVSVRINTSGLEGEKISLMMGPTSVVPQLITAGKADYEFENLRFGTYMAMVENPPIYKIVILTQAKVPTNVEL